MSVTMSSPERIAARARRQVQAPVLRQLAVASKVSSSAALSAQRHAEAQARRRQEEAEREAERDFAAAKQAQFERALAHMNPATPSAHAHIADDISDIEEDDELFDWLDGLAAMSPSPVTRPLGAPRSPAWRPSGSSPWVEKPPPALTESPSRTRLLLPPRQAGCGAGAQSEAQGAWTGTSQSELQHGTQTAQGNRRPQASKLGGKPSSRPGSKPGTKLSAKQVGLARRREGTNPWLRPPPLETAPTAPDDDARAVEQDDHEPADVPFEADYGPANISYAYNIDHGQRGMGYEDHGYVDPMPLDYGNFASRPSIAPSESGGRPPLSALGAPVAEQEAPPSLAGVGTEIDLRLDKILAGITLRRLRDEQSRLEQLLDAHKEEAATERRRTEQRDHPNPVVNRSASHGVLPVRNPRPHMSTHGCRPDRDGVARPLLASRPLMPSRAPWPSAWLTTGVGPSYHGIDGQAPACRLGTG